MNLQDIPEDVVACTGSVHALHPVPQGMTSEVAIADCEKGRFVLKHSDTAPFSDWLAREYAMLLMLGEYELPIPKTYCLVTDQRDGQLSRWLVMSVLPGEPLSAVLARHPPEVERHQLLRTFGAVLARIHATIVPDTFSGQPHWLDRILQEAEHNLMHFPTDGDAALLERLRKTRPRQTAHTLIHGDYTIDNVMVENGRVTGIIDWGRGDWGDPRYDLVLATERLMLEHVFLTHDDFDAFYVGYGGMHVSTDEQAYFESLYEFF